MLRSAFHIAVAATTLLTASAAETASIQLKNLKVIQGPPGQSVTQVAINDNGDIAGTAFNFTTFVSSGFLLPFGGSFSFIKPPDAVDSSVYGINNQQILVGWYLNGNAGEYGFSYLGGIYTAINVGPNAYTFVNGVNNSGDMTGSWTLSSGGTGFVIHNGVTTVFFVPGYQFQTYPEGINDHGQIVGYVGDAATPPTGFLRQSDGSFQPLVFEAQGINNAGIIVGVANDANDNAMGIVRIGSVDYSFMYPGAMDTYLYGVNNHGEVIGIYVDSNFEVHIFEGQIPSA